MKAVTLPFFAPHLTLKVLLPAMAFYEKAFGAKELHRWTNEDGAVHVAEMEIEGALFHLHEEVPRNRELSPETLSGVSTLIGIFVEDPHSFMKRAVAAGGTEHSPVTDYDYGYRQGRLIDPFGHHWLIQRKI